MNAGKGTWSGQVAEWIPAVVHRSLTVFLASSTLRRKSGDRPTHAIRYLSF
jgi:hypothetical protein